MSEDRRKRVFRTAAGVSLAVLLPVAAVGLSWVRRVLGLTWDNMGPTTALALVLSGALSALVGRYFCRRMGLPLSRRATERLVRSRQPRRDGGSAEVRSDMPRRFWISLLVVYFGFGAVHLVSEAVGAVVWGIFYLLLLALFVWWVGYVARARPNVYADDEGITRRSFVMHQTESVPWDAVASCTIEASTGSVFSRSGEVACVFRDHAGKVILRVALPDASSEESTRFLEYIREYQGLQSAPVELVAADPPEGTGTEPEAASAPEGTGTEPEAAAGPGEPEARAQGWRVRTP